MLRLMIAAGLRIGLGMPRTESQHYDGHLVSLADYCRFNNICFQLALVADDVHWCSSGSQWHSKIFPLACAGSPNTIVA